MQDALFVVAKRPAPGHSKTRLCPPLTGEQAAALYECFLRDTLDVMRAAPGVACGIAYLTDDAGQDASAREYFNRLAPDMALTPQMGQNLGERLDNLLTDALAQGAHTAVVMDSDSPTLPSDYLAQAFTLLHSDNDVVLGPCDDGGYYLIGLKKPQPRLLREVSMSTSSVLRDTLAIAEALHLRVGLLPMWFDVDTVAELERLRLELAQSVNGAARHTRYWLQPSEGAAYPNQVCLPAFRSIDS